MSTKKEIVIKSNKLIDMQTDLSLIQLKVFTKLIMTTIKNPNEDFYRFSIRDLLSDFNISSPHYTALKNATAGMIKAVILKTDNGEVQLPLFTEVNYHSGIVDIYLHPKLKPYILDIKQRYTKYFFKNITGLNSMYSMRLYELLKEFEFRKNRSFELSHLRFLLNISETKYSKYTDFKKRVLLSSQKELEEKTDISFIFEEIRESRKVVKINFTIISKQKEILEDINSLNNSLQGILKTKLFLSNIQIKTVLKQFDNDYINRNITYTLNQKNIKNISGYFLKALEQDFGESLVLQKEQKTKVHQKEKNKLAVTQLLKKFSIYKSHKIEDYKNNNPKVIKNLVSLFIIKNMSILKKERLDIENIEEIEKAIKNKRSVKSFFNTFLVNEHLKNEFGTFEEWAKKQNINIGKNTNGDYILINK